MNTRIISLRFLCAAGLALSATAQQQTAAAVLSSVPFYPPDGQIPEALKDHFVFVDPAKNEIVVSYPDQSVVGGRRVQRFERASYVEPAFASSVSARNEGGYSYKYTLQNKQTAGRPLKSAALIVSKSDTKLLARHPSWSVSAARPDISRAGAVRPETLLTWSAGPSTLLGKGAALGGFEIVSDFRPGLTIAFAEAAVEKALTPETAAGFPEIVKKQLASLMDPQLNAAQAMTIGPRFAPGDPKAIIAMDFHSGLNKLSVLGPLKPDSPFVTGALSALVSYMAASDSNVLALDFLDKAAPGLESEIAAAMRLSLR